MKDGLKEVPGLKGIFITEAGDVYNYHSDKYLKSRINGRGYVVINITVYNIEKSYRVHRLIALTYIPIPDRYSKYSVNDLQVNHINGIKHDNRIENLEWCTAKENMNHAITNGLTKHDPIYSKNIRTGVVTKYSTTHECARQYGISAQILLTHLKSSKEGLLTRDWCIFKRVDNNWEDLRKIEYKENTLFRNGYWLAVDSEGRKFYNRTLEELCDHLLLKYITVSHRYKKNKNEIIFGYKFYYYLYSIREIEKILNKKKTNNAGIKIIVKDTVTNNVLEFNSKAEASKSINMPVSTIDYMLKNKIPVKGNFEIYTKK